MKLRLSKTVHLMAMTSFLAVAMLVASVTASATPPIKVPNLAADTIFEGICSFDVGVHFTSQNLHARAFSNGVFAGEGQLFATLTNLSTRKSIDVNISGPGRFTPNSDGTTSVMFEGHNLFFFLPGQLGPGSPGALYLTIGLTTETVGLDGAPIPGTFATHGPLSDVCALLA